MAGIYGHEKEYEVLIEGIPSDQTLAKWRRGSVVLDGERVAPCQVERLRTEREGGKQGVWLRVVMREGRKRQIKRVALALGHPVHQIIRTRIGSLKLGRLKVGTWRHLTQAEVNALRAAARAMGSPTRPRADRRRPAGPPSTRRKKPPARK